MFRLTGDESEINLLGDGSEKPEFSEYKWVDANQVVNKVGQRLHSPVRGPALSPNVDILPTFEETDSKSHLTASTRAAFCILFSRRGFRSSVVNMKSVDIREWGFLFEREI